MKAMSYVHSLRNHLEAIHALIHEIYGKGPPFPPEIWVKQMRRQRATLNNRILDIQNAAGRDRPSA